MILEYNSLYCPCTGYGEIRIATPLGAKKQKQHKAIARALIKKTQ